MAQAPARRQSAGSRRLQQQAAGYDPVAGTAPSGSPQAITPDAAMYGVFQPQYAASLAQAQGSPTGDPLRHGALAINADTESRRYADALEHANQTQQALQQQAIYGALQGRVAGNAVGMAQQGLTGAESVRMGPNGPEYVIDPVAAIDHNQNFMSNDTADRYGIQTQGIKNLYDAGIRTPEATVEALLTPPRQQESPDYGVFNSNGMSNKDTIDQYDAESGRISANAAMVAAHRPPSGGASGGPAFSIELPSQGYGAEATPKVTVRGRGPQMEQYMGGNIPGRASPTPALPRRLAAAAARGATVAPSANGFTVTKPDGQVVNTDRMGNTVQ